METIQQSGEVPIQEWFFEMLGKSAEGRLKSGSEELWDKFLLHLWQNPEDRKCIVSGLS